MGIVGFCLFGEWESEWEECFKERKEKKKRRRPFWRGKGILERPEKEKREKKCEKERKKSS